MEQHTDTNWVHSDEYGWGIQSDRDPAVVFVYDQVRRVWVERPADSFWSQPATITA